MYIYIYILPHDSYNVHVYRVTMKSLKRGREVVIPFIYLSLAGSTPQSDNTGYGVPVII